MLRSVGAITAGFFTTVALAVGTDALVQSIRQPSSPARLAQSAGWLVAALVYTAAFAVVGAYVAARLAPRRALLHAMILGVVSVLISVPVVAASWHTAPVWYNLIALIQVLPAVFVGGWLRERQVSDSVARAHGATQQGSRRAP